MPLPIFNIWKISLIQKSQTQVILLKKSNKQRNCTSLLMWKPPHSHLYSRLFLFWTFQSVEAHLLTYTPPTHTPPHLPRLSPLLDFSIRGGTPPHLHSPPPHTPTHTSQHPPLTETIWTFQSIGGAQNTPPHLQTLKHTRPHTLTETIPSSGLLNRWRGCYFSWCPTV